MLRGFLSGGVWGGLISALVLVVTSLYSDLPPGNLPPLAPGVDAPGLQPGAGALVDEAGDAVPGGDTDPGGAPAPSRTPEVSGPQDTPAAISARPQADTAPPDVPQTGDADRAIAEPAAPRAAPVLGGGADEPVSVIAGADAPLAPAPEVAPEADQDSATPLSSPTGVEPDSPALSAPEAAAAPELSVAEEDVPPDTGGAAPQAPPSPGAEAQDRDLGDPSETAPLPEAETEIAAAPTPSTEEPPAPGAPSPAERGQQSGADSPEIAPPAIDDLPPRSPDDPSPDGRAVLVEVPEDASEAVQDETISVTETPPEAASAPPATPETDAPDAPEEPLISLRGSDAALPEGTPGVRVIRPGEQGAPETPVDEVPADADLPALEAHAAEWTPADPALPLLSIILIDEGALGPAGIEAVAAIPFPVSIAIDATRTDAAERIAAYRARGVEVLAIARLPEGATPQDAEVILGTALDAAPQTIALLDPGDGGLQGDRGVTELAMARLAESGRGFVTASRGLNTALRTAEAEGVPASVLYRDLDSEGQEARVIRRFLDQAAFRARQQSGVVLLGRVRADTISGLTLWGSAARASQVNLAPVSAVLTAP